MTRLSTMSCAALGVLATVATACSGGGGAGDGGRGSNGSSTSYLPPRYEWAPGTPGRAVGVHAEATIAGSKQRSNEIEIELLDSGASRGSVARSENALSSSAVRSASQALCSTELGQPTTAFETQADRICWISYGASGGAFGAGGSVSSNLIYTREGTYAAPFASMDIYFPPDLVGYGNFMSVGCLASDEGQIPVAYVNGLRALSVSVSFTNALTLGLLPKLVGGPGAGFSVFVDESQHMAKAVQYDTSLATLSIELIPSPVQIRFQTMSGFIRDPWLTRKDEDSCNENGNPFEESSGASPTALTLPAPNRRGDDELQSAADELLAPLLHHLASEEGFGPGQNMMAGSNADAFASLGGPGTANDAAPSSSFDDLLSKVQRGVEESSNDREIAAVLARNAGDLQNILPSTVLLDHLLLDAAAGVELANDAALAADPYRAAGLIRIDAVAGEPVELEYSAHELADLLDVEEAAVLGATLHLSATHTISASDHVLDDSTLGLTFTPKSSAPLLIRARVDLSTAAGPLDDAFEDVEPRLAPRLVVPKEGPPMHIGLYAAKRVAAGGAITLSAIVTDANGNISKEPLDVELFDGEDHSLGIATTEHGVATLQYVPEASTPNIEGAEATELVNGNDETFPGFEIIGSGFSVDAQLWIGGELRSAEKLSRTVRSASSILVVLDAPAGTTVQVQNPGGAKSNRVTIED